MAATAEPTLSTQQKALYDRQIGAIGMETMTRLIQQRVLIFSCCGLGVEIAKNVILAGPAAVTIADSGLVEMTDLSAQFYLKKEDIGRNRAEACIDALKELNPHVVVSAHTEPVTRKFVQEFSVVVMTASTPEEKIKVNDFCHENGVKFISAEIHGLFSCVFNDFGPAHIVSDTDGERERVGWVADISQTNPCVVTLLEDFPYAFQAGDYVVLSEVLGMSEINGRKAAKVTIKDKYNIELDIDATTFQKYSQGGIITQVKMPAKIAMRRLAEARREPGELSLTDYSKVDRPAQLHVAFGGLNKFQDAHQGALPEFLNTEHEEEVITMAKEFNETLPLSTRVKVVDVDMVRLLAQHARVDLSPMASIIGGIVAQEVIKVTGKHTPINQFLYFDALECLPSGHTNRAANNSRHDGQINVFGRGVQQKLRSLKVFLVGAGALGCEFLKGFAMMGVGKVTVTDMDFIETSNLNRQFLFRNRHLQKPKSTTAAEAVLAMNDDMKVEAQQLRVGYETENVFNDQFWNDKNVVVNALDNVNARLYVDSKCVNYRKPLLESGTLGTKANTQVIIPMKTESYGSSRDPPEKDTPMCTLHNFPYLIEHCIQLAREQFETLFTKSVLDTQAFLTHGDEHVKSLTNMHERRVTLESIDELIQARGCSFTDCVRWARLKFDEQFNHRVKQMLASFPADKKDEHGVPFWSGTKRVPHPLEFDASDEAHMQFVFCAANLRAGTLKVVPNTDLEAVRKIAAAVQLDPWQPKQGITIQADAKADAPPVTMDDDDDVVKSLMISIPRTTPPTAFVGAEFEKDNDANHHIDCIAAAANLRARCYDIGESTRGQIKMIAGRIIPALATTTAMATGFALLELYKLVQDRPVEDHRNAFINLALPLITVSEPVPPKSNTTPGPQGEIYYPDGYTEWDRFTINEGDITLQRVLDWFEQHHKLTVSIISVGEAVMYASFMPAHKDRPKEKVSTLYANYTKEEIPKSIHTLQLIMGCENADGQEVDIPPTFVKFR